MVLRESWTQLAVWAIFAGISLLTGPLRAADPAFVGVLALALEDELSQELELSDEVRQQLRELVQQRESEALGLVLEIRELSPEEQRERLAPFVAASEEQGLKLLTEEQRGRLQQLQIRRAGLRSLAEPRIAEQLGLTVEQQQAIQQILQEQQDASAATVTDEERARRNAEVERRLAGVLDPSQQAIWQHLAGLAPAAGQVADSGSEPSASSPAGSDSPAETSVANPPSSARSGTAPNRRGQPRLDSATVASSPPAGSNSPAAANLDDAASNDARLRFNFRFAPWKDVLEWFAEQADLSLQMDAPPPGTFNYTDSRSYTPAEAVDLLNGVLLTKGYTLVRRERMLTVINLEDEIPPELVEFVPAEQLDKRGQFELIKTLFSLHNITPEEAQAELQPLIGPQGKLVVLPTSRQLLVTETAGRLRTIRTILQRIENPEAGGRGKFREIALNNVTAEEVIEVARPLLGLPAGQNTAEGISISTDPLGSRLFITGTPDKVEILEQLVRRVDVATPGTRGALSTTIETPQLLTYPIRAADPNTVLQVMQTLLAGQPNTRLTLDPQSNKLVALARPSDHATIRATLAELEGEASHFEVIQLRRLDPQMAVLTINKMFGTTAENGTGPKVDGDPTSRQLWVRGTRSEVQQIRDLVEKLEGSSLASGGDRGNIRVLPLTGAGARTALDNARLLWPSVGNNPIRVVTPSATAPALQGRVPGESSGSNRRAQPGSSSSQAPATQELEDPTTHRTSNGVRGMLVSFQDEPDETEAAADEEGFADEYVLPANDPPAAERGSREETSPSNRAQKDIIVSITPSGIVIASEDTEALDRFETLLRTLGSTSAAPGQTPTVYWLRYVRAEVAAELLNQVINGTSSSSGGGSVLGDMASELIGGVGGGMLGALLTTDSGTSVAYGAASIVADPRLNALIIQASPTDLLLIEQLLQVIDQESSPEDVQTVGKPRLIPVIYTNAQTVADVLRQVYADRIAGSNAGRQQPTPEDFIRALRGGGNGRGGGGSQQTRGEPPKMTIGVDPQSNSLIVTAPEPLFREVEALVATIDQAGTQTNEKVEVYTIQAPVNPELLQKALASMMGPSARVTNNTGATSSTTSGNASQQNANGPDMEEIRRRMEFFQRVREGINQGGGGGGGQRFFGGGGGGGGNERFGEGRGGGAGGGGGGGGGGPRGPEGRQGGRGR